MSEEREGQLSVCESLAKHSMAELISEYGNACAELEIQYETGYGASVGRAETYHEALIQEFARRGITVTFGYPA